MLAVDVCCRPVRKAPGPQTLYMHHSPLHLCRIHTHTTRTKPVTLLMIKLMAGVPGLLISSVHYRLLPCHQASSSDPSCGVGGQQQTSLKSLSTVAAHNQNSFMPSQNDITLYSFLRWSSFLIGSSGLNFPAITRHGQPNLHRVPSGSC